MAKSVRLVTRGRVSSRHHASKSNSNVLHLSFYYSVLVVAMARAELMLHVLFSTVGFPARGAVDWFCVTANEGDFGWVNVVLDVLLEVNPAGEGAVFSIDHVEVTEAVEVINE